MIRNYLNERHLLTLNAFAAVFYNFFSSVFPAVVKMGGNNLNLLNPPEQFGIVEPGIYRSDMLQQPHFTYLKQFGFKTLVMLSPELPNRVTSNFIEEGNIKLVHVGMATWKPTQPSTWRPVSEELIKEGLELILDVETHPILIMCT